MGKLFSILRTMIACGVVVLSLLYGYFCFFNYRYEEPEKTAKRLEYRAHLPAHVEQLYKRSIAFSPADAEPLVAYAEYLYGKGCCVRTIGQLLEEVLRRNPRSSQVYHAAIIFFVNQGEKEKANRYLIETIGLEGQASPGLLERMLDGGADLRGAIANIPRTEDNLRTLMKVLSKRGEEYKTEWNQLRMELASYGQPDPLEIAAQALKVGELEIARDQALIAMENPKTEARARKILKKADSSGKKY